MKNEMVASKPKRATQIMVIAAIKKATPIHEVQSLVACKKQA